MVVPERDGRRHAPADLPWLSDGVIIDSRLGTTGGKPRRAALSAELSQVFDKLSEKVGSPQQNQ